MQIFRSFSHYTFGLVWLGLALLRCVWNISPLKACFYVFWMMHSHKYVHRIHICAYSFCHEQKCGPNLAMPVCRLNDLRRYEFHTDSFATDACTRMYDAQKTHIYFPNKIGQTKESAWLQFISQLDLIRDVGFFILRNLVAAVPVGVCVLRFIWF